MLDLGWGSPPYFLTKMLIRCDLALDPWQSLSRIRYRKRYLFANLYCNGRVKRLGAEGV
jgi:hypothetical protein